MTEKEMIEEMAMIALKNTMSYTCAKQIAMNFYEQGYRKIPEGSVVLSKENYEILPEGSVVLDRHEHQNYCAYKIIEPQIRGCLDRERELEKQVAELEEQRDRQAYIAEELIQEKHNWTEQVRKETAKKILQLILNESGIDILGNCYKLPTRTFNKIKRQFGVEVEE